MTDDPSDQAPELHLPEGLHYRCILCGRCCRDFWEIPVEPREADAVAAQARGVLAGSGKAVVPSPWTAGAYMMRLDGDACCLLDSAGLCRLHTQCGFEAKPNICRSFPFRYARTPGGDFVGLSFACTAVLREEGPAVAARRGELEDQSQWTHSRHPIQEPLELTVDLPLSWPQYAQIESDLAELLDSPHESVGQRLVAQSIYLDLLCRFLRQAREQADALVAGPEVNDPFLKVFRDRMRGKENDRWPLPRALAGKRRGSPLLRRTILGFAHQLRNIYGQRRGRTLTYLMLARTYFGFAAGRGTIELPGCAHPTHYRQIRSIRFDPLRPEADALLTRYFRHSLFRKDLLLVDSIRMGHQMQLLQWGLIRWYSAAFAHHADTDRIDMDHLREGLRVVEMFYGFHSRFGRLFQRYPLARGFLDRLLNHPLYAYSMGRDPGEPSENPTDRQAGR